jgi:hypothetical protein
LHDQIDPYSAYCYHKIIREAWRAERRDRKRQ